MKPHFLRLSDEWEVRPAAIIAVRELNVGNVIVYLSNGLQIPCSTPASAIREACGEKCATPRRELPPPPAVEEPPAEDEPAEDEPAVEEPPAVDEPVEDEPAVEEPAPAQPAVEEPPAVDDPAHGTDGTA